MCKVNKDIVQFFDACNKKFFYDFPFALSLLFEIYDLKFSDKDEAKYFIDSVTFLSQRIYEHEKANKPKP